MISYQTAVELAARQSYVTTSIEAHNSVVSTTSTALMQGAGMARENMEMVIKSMLAMQTRTMAHE